MNTRGRLAGKRVLVTGSGTGIGREIALEFAAKAPTSCCITPTAATERSRLLRRFARWVAVPP